MRGASSSNFKRRSTLIWLANASMMPPSPFSKQSFRCRLENSQNPGPISLWPVQSCVQEFARSLVRGDRSLGFKPCCSGLGHAFDISDQQVWFQGDSMTELIGISSGYCAMLGCDLVLTLGTDFPYRQFYPTPPSLIFHSVL